MLVVNNLVHRRSLALISASCLPSMDDRGTILRSTLEVLDIVLGRYDGNEALRAAIDRAWPARLTRCVHLASIVALDSTMSIGTMKQIQGA